MTTRYSIILADSHGGHRLGLLNPAIGLPDEGPEGQLTYYKPTLTATQAQLWEWYEQCMAWARARVNGADVTLIHNGDITSGDKYSEGNVTSRPADQLLIGAGNLAPWLLWPNVKRVRLIHGTGAHEYGEGSAAYSVAALLQGAFTATDIKVVRHGLFDLDGVTLDVAHHGPGPGGREWLLGNQLRYYTRSVMLDHIARGQRPPDVLIRAHYHTSIQETVRVGQYVTEALLLPGFCGLSHYAVQATRSAYMLSVGLALIAVEDGRLTAVEPWVRSEDLRTREAL